MKGKRYHTIQDIQRASTEVLKTISKIKYSDCFEKFFSRFQHCIDSEGVCFKQKINKNNK